MLPLVKRRFFEWQISGAADILVKSVGYIPGDNISSDHVEKPESVVAVERLEVWPSMFI